MDKILEMIWWPMVVALIPLDAGTIMNYIHEEYFGVCFSGDAWSAGGNYFSVCS